MQLLSLNVFSEKELPTLFGTEYPDTIDQFFQRNKLGPQHLLELGIQPQYNIPAAVDSGNDNKDSDD